MGVSKITGTTAGMDPNQQHECKTNTMQRGLPDALPISDLQNCQLN